MYVCKLRVAQITFVLNEITHPFDTTEKRYSYIIQLKEHEAFIYIHIYIFKLYDMSFNMDWKEDNSNIPYRESSLYRYGRAHRDATF